MAMIKDANEAWVAGADGCPAGWLVVFRPINGKAARAQIFARIADVLAAPERPAVLAIDIPIGLPTISLPGGRAADIAARQVLSFRKPSIFPAPSRPVLKAKSFRDAQRIESKNSTPEKKLAKQVFYLLEKIRELDELATSYAGIIFECHPEVSFWAMNDKVEMSLPKKTRDGFEQRCEILRQKNYDRAFLKTRIGRLPDHGRDDFVDACAAAWTAERIFKNEAIRFPPKANFDDRGIDMAIWA